MFKKSLRTSKLAKRKRKIFFFKLAGFFAVIFALAVSLFFLSRMDAVAVEEIRVSGNSVLSDEEIVETVREAISKDYFLIWHGANTLLFPKSQAENALLDKFKRIEEVEIGRRGFQELDVSVRERTPYATWCASDSEEAANLSDRCFFMDRSGFIFAEAPSFSGSVYFRYYGVLEEESPIGLSFLFSEEFQRLEEFKEMVKRLGLSPIFIIHTEESDFEMHLEEGSRIIFNSERDSLNLVSNLQTVISEKETLGEFESFMSEIEYIDLRFGNKVFYRELGFQESSSEVAHEIEESREVPQEEFDYPGEEVFNMEFNEDEAETIGDSEEEIDDQLSE